MKQTREIRFIYLSMCRGNILCIHVLKVMDMTANSLVMVTTYHCIAQLDTPFCCNVEGTHESSTIPGDRQALYRRHH